MHPAPPLVSLYFLHQSLAYITSLVDFLPIIDARGRLWRVQIIGLSVKSRLGQSLHNKVTLEGTLYCKQSEIQR